MTDSHQYITYRMLIDPVPFQADIQTILPVSIMSFFYATYEVRRISVVQYLVEVVWKGCEYCTVVLVRFACISKPHARLQLRLIGFNPLHFLCSPCSSSIFPSLPSLRVHLTWSLFCRETTGLRNPYHFQRTNGLTILDCVRSYFTSPEEKKWSMHKKPRWNRSSSHSAWSNALYIFYLLFPLPPIISSFATLLRCPIYCAMPQKFGRNAL